MSREDVRPGRNGADPAAAASGMPAPATQEPARRSDPLAPAPARESNPASGTRSGLRFRTLGEYEFDLTVLLDRTGRITSIDPSALHLFGVDPDGMVGTDVFGFLEPSSAGPMRDLFAELIERRRASAFLQMHARRPGGPPLALDVVAIGHDDGLVLNIRNTTEPVARQRRRPDSHRAPSVVVAALPDGVMVVDADGLVTGVNEAFEVMFVRPRVQIIGQPLIDLLVTEAEEGIQLMGAGGAVIDHQDHPLLVSLRMERRSVGHLVERRRPNAESQWVRVSAQPLVGEDGVVTGAVATFADVTEDQRSYDALRSEVRLLRGLAAATGSFEVVDGPDERTVDASRTGSVGEPASDLGATDHAGSRVQEDGEDDEFVEPFATSSRALVPFPLDLAPSNDKSPPSTSWMRSAGLLSLATILISLGNYAFSLTVVRLLHPVAFSRFSAGQSVLLVLSNGGMAAIPWAVARYVVLEPGPQARSEALSFGLRASALLSLVAAAAAEVILIGVAGPAVATVTAVGAALMFMVAGPVGYLQGTNRVGKLANFRMLEVIVRVATGLIVVLLLSRTASWALVGFPVGAAVMLGVSVAACRDGFPLRRPHASATRSLIVQSIRLGAVQLALVSLGAIDAVAILASHLSADQAASYLAASLIGRIPLFISTAISIAVFAALTASRDDREVGDHLRQMLRFYAVLTVPVVIGCFTVPHSLLAVLIPHTYSSAPTLLKYTCLSGAAIGLLNCVTTAHQARGRIRPALIILVPAAVLQPVLLIVLGRSAGIDAFCIGLVGLSVVTTLVVLWDARRWLPLHRPALLSVLLVLVIGALAVLAGQVTGALAWIAVMLAVSAAVTVVVLCRPKRRAESAA